MAGEGKASPDLRMRQKGNLLEITIGDSPSRIRDFKTEFSDYAPLLDMRRGEPSFEELKRMVKKLVPIDEAKFNLVLHIEAENGIPVRREVRVYVDSKSRVLCAMARWASDEGVFVGTIN